MDKQAPKEIAGFVRKVRSKWKPSEIILFGSRARGDAWKQSDYDFIIVSSRFNGLHWHDRISKVIRAWNLLAGIDVLPYTPQEFEEKKRNSSTVRNALKEGLLLK